MLSTIRTYLTLNPNLRTTLAAWGLVCFATFGVAAVLQNLYLLRLGFGADSIGLLNGAAQLARAVLALPAGIFAQRSGTRGGLIASYTAAATSYLLFVAVEWLPREDWQAWLLGSQLLLGLGMALNSTSMFPYLITMATEQERLHAFAAQRGVTAAATFLGSLLAGVLPGWLATVMQPGDAVAPYRVVLALVALMHYLAALTMLKAQAAPAAQAPAPGTAGARPPLMLFLGVGGLTLLMVAGEGAVRTFFNVFMDSRLGADTAQIGLVVALTSVIVVTIAFGAPPLLARLGTGGSMAVGLGGVALGALVLAFAAHWQIAGIGYALVVAISSLTSTARNLFVQELAPAHARTSMAAIHSIGVAIGLAGAAMLGGYLIGFVGFPGMFLAAALISLLCVPLSTRFVARHALRPAPASPAM